MKTIVVGGGASGMLCAYFRSINGEDVILIEKNVIKRKLKTSKLLNNFFFILSPTY